MQKNISLKEKHEGRKKCQARSPCKVSSQEELILYALDKSEEYGLGIVKVIEDASYGHRTIRMGSLYPALSKLEKKQLISSRWGDEEVPERCGARRRYYQLTEEGRYTLDYLISFRENLLNRE